MMQKHKNLGKLEAQKIFMKDDAQVVWLKICAINRDGSTVKMQDDILLHKTGKARFLAKNFHFTPEFTKISHIF